MLAAAPDVLRIEEDIQALGLDLRIAAVLARTPSLADPRSRRRKGSTDVTDSLVQRSQAGQRAPSPAFTDDCQAFMAKGNGMCR